MLVTVPENVMVASSVPSPVVKDRPETDARDIVPVLTATVTESIDESSTSEISVPVMSPAVSSLTVKSLAVPLNVGASFSAANEVVIT